MYDALFENRSLLKSIIDERKERAREHIIDVETNTHRLVLFTKYITYEIDRVEWERNIVRLARTRLPCA